MSRERKVDAMLDAVIVGRRVEHRYNPSFPGGVVLALSWDDCGSFWLLVANDDGELAELRATEYDLVPREDG